MNLHSLRSWLAAFLAAMALEACSPPASAPTELGAETQGVEPPPPPAERRGAAAPRPERRPDRAAASQGTGQWKYIDEGGQLRLAARLEDVPESQRSTAIALSSAGARSRTRAPTEEARAGQTVDVTIYTTSWCGYCSAAIAHFEANGIDYVNHDVEADEDARAEALELTGGRRGVPVIVVGEAWMQGWSRHEFDRLLAQSGS